MMMKRFFVLALVALMAVPALPQTASAFPAKFREGLFNLMFNRHGNIPRCDDGFIHSNIRNRFRKYTDRNVLKLGLAIEAIDHVGETAFEIDNPSPLARRYCQARAHFNDNRSRNLYYFIEESTGFVGIKYNVEYCVAGLDPWRVYDGRCRITKPPQRY